MNDPFEFRHIKFEFTLPDRIWSTNDERNMHFSQRHELVKAWKGATRMNYLAYRNKREIPPRLAPGIVQLAIPVRDRRKRDPHNYCGTVLKAVIDGLVLAEVWPDDTPEYVGHREPVLYVGNVVMVDITPKE